LSNVLGQPVSACLPTGEGADRWLRRINECQMVLHGHAVNQRRAVSGQPLINGLWLWGGGAMPAAGHMAYSLVQTARSVLSGLARLHDVPHISPVNQTECLSVSHHSVLVDLDTCEAAACSGDR
jgi:hypothetical protein